ncbi:hypothetical protein MNBD_GAMMA02-331 [hydrothermal vent metagenome]|uniref:Uncharacterized protein n=1 Tax=hydrothermal vent metagenome TaxID=652676 RepID=A0A3B0WJZ2_9ZZZZ
MTEKVIVARESLILDNNFSLFMRIVLDTYRFAANVKILSRSIFEENSLLFDDNNGKFWQNPAFRTTAWMQLVRATQEQLPSRLFFLGQALLTRP